MVTWKCLLVLYGADHLADLDSDRPGASEPPGLDAGDDGGEQLLGGGQQVLALAGPVGGQHRVAAGDQPLAGEVRAGDLGQVLLVEEAELERAVVGHQLLDGRGAQRGDPPVGVGPGGAVPGLVQGGDPGAGDHAPVADHDHVPQLELLPDDRDDLGERGGVAGVAGEDPDRDRAALGVGEQPVLDLQLAFLAVPGVAAGGQRAVRAFQPRAGQVEQGHLRRVRGRGQVAAGQPGLDRVLLAGQPVHRGVDVVGGRAGCAQVGAQGRVSPPGQGGQLGGRGHDPGDDQRQGQVPLAARRAQQRGQAQLGGHRCDGGDVAVRQGPGDGDRLGGGHQRGAFQARVDQVDDVIGQRGDVGDGLVLDLAGLPVGAAQVGRGVVLAAALLVDVPGLGDSDYVDFPARSRHSQILQRTYPELRCDTPIILTTLCGQMSPEWQVRTRCLLRATATSG